MPKYISLFVCGCCGKDTRKTDSDIEKVVLGGYANMLCRGCRMALEDDVAAMARRYLGKKLEKVVAERGAP